MAVPANKETAVSEPVHLHHRAQRNDRNTFGIHHPVGLFLVLNGVARVQNPALLPAKNVLQTQVGRNGAKGRHRAFRGYRELPVVTI